MIEENFVEYAMKVLPFRHVHIVYQNKLIYELVVVENLIKGFIQVF